MLLLVFLLLLSKVLLAFKKKKNNAGVFFFSVVRKNIRKSDRRVRHKVQFVKFEKSCKEKITKI